MSLNMMHVVYYVGKTNCDTTGTFVIRIFHDKLIRFGIIVARNQHSDRYSIGASSVRTCTPFVTVDLGSYIPHISLLLLWQHVNSI